VVRKKRCVSRFCISFLFFLISYDTLVSFIPSSPLFSSFCRYKISVLFTVGILGNFYHHYLLASLRKNRHGATTKRYIAPHGGLFDFVAAPHYLFELMGWLGIAIVANHLNAYLTFGSMCSYLAGRAVSQNAWNQKVFSKDEWPTSRKNLIPFIF